MQNFLSSVKQKARQLQKTMLFPEAFDERTLRAIAAVIEEGTVRPLALGKLDELQKIAQNFNITVAWDKFECIDVNDNLLQEQYAEAFYQLRREKGITKDQALKAMQDINYFAVMLLQQGRADGMVSGAVSSTADTVRPALQIIKTKEKFHKVSGVFFMVLENRVLLFADCAINIDPNSHDLADIAIDTASTAKAFGLEPKIAMLSFSTNGSAKHPLVDKVKESIALIHDRAPQLLVEGEMQVDAALVPAVAKRKFPTGKIQGDANILIFPDLQSGNIAYKLVERLAGAQALGPLLQGLQKPLSDLSRGCSWQDIANLAAITACQADELEHEQ